MWQAKIIFLIKTNLISFDSFDVYKDVFERFLQ